MSISAVIATLNEEKNLKRCLKSIDFVDEIIIVDSGSSDKTVEIAKKFTKKIFFTDFKGFSQIKQYGIEKAKSEWVLIIDADEEVSDNLKQKLLEIDKKGNNINGFYIKRETFFLGKKIKYCGWGKDYQLRFFKKNKGAFDGKIVHEALNVQGKMGYIDFPLYHYSYPDVKSYFDKMNRYTTLQAKQKKGNLLLFKMIFNPFFKFFKMYFLRLGFLDGIHGLILSLFSGFSEFVKYAKMIEIKKFPNEEAILIRVPNWIGDAVVSTAFLKETKRIFKKLYVLADKSVSDIFEKNPAIDELITFNKSKILDVISVIFKLRKYNIRTAITLTPSFSSALIFLLSGIKIRCGFSDDGFLLNRKYKRDKNHSEKHLIEEFKEVFYLASYKFDFKDIKQEIFVDNKMESEVLKNFKLNKRKFNIFISPFVKYGPAKMWDIRKFNELIEVLKEKIKNSRIYIIGTRQDLEYKFNLSKNVIDLRGKTTLKEIIYLIKNTNLFIGNDSGIMHIADAFEIPSLIVFGSTSPDWTGPLSNKVKILKANIHCSPCFKKECRYKTYECLKLITVEMSVKKIFSMIKK
jgi:lipopolysaccharide heptosyltransferase II